MLGQQEKKDFHCAERDLPVIFAGHLEEGVPGENSAVSESPGAGAGRWRRPHRQSGRP